MTPKQRSPLEFHFERAAKKFKTEKNLVREVFAHQSIQNGAEQSAQNGHQHRRVTRSDQNEQWAGTAARHGPTHAENCAANQVPFPTHGVLEDVERLPIDGLPAEAFGQLNENGPQHHSGSDHTVHVKGLELEHFRNPIPTHNLTLGQGDAKQNANQNKSKHDIKGSKNEGKDKMCDGEPADKKTNDGNQRWQLKAAQAADGMA